MGFILTVITILFALDLLWMWQSDHLLRGLRRARWWRGANLAFVGMQVLILLWIVVGRWMNLHPGQSAPKAVVAGVLIWHLIVLPLAVVLWAIPAIPLALVRAVRSLSSVLRGEGRGERRLLSSDVQRRAHPPPLPSPLPGVPGRGRATRSARMVPRHPRSPLSRAAPSSAPPR